MEERLEWLMAVSSSQVELDSKMDDWFMSMELGERT